MLFAMVAAVAMISCIQCSLPRTGWVHDFVLFVGGAPHDLCCRWHRRRSSIEVPLGAGDEGDRPAMNQTAMGQKACFGYC